MPGTALTLDDVTGLRGVTQPRIWTPRAAGYPSMMEELRELAELCGITLLGWQEITLDVALEYDPATGRWTRPTIVVLVARQNGKTVIIQLRILGQLFLFDLLQDGRPQTVLHTAQDRTVARETFLEIAGLIENTPALNRQLKRNGIREANGQESIKLKSGASYRVLAPRQSAFRYWSSDLVVLDEIREHRTVDVLSAAQYTQRAKPNGQIWATSNAGDMDSIVLNAMQDRGRAAAAGSQDRTIGYLEWSGEDNADTDDLRAWEQANPALGVLIDGRAILEERKRDDETKFRTEALCIREQGSGEPAIPPAVWRSLATEDLPQLAPGDVRPVLAVDLDPTRQTAAIVAVADVELDSVTHLIAATLETWRSDPDGVVTEEVVAAALQSWAKAFRPSAIAYDPFTTSGVVNQVVRLNPDLMIPVTGVDWYVASGQLWAVCVARRLRYDPTDTELVRQVLAAARADVGDGTWRITRKQSGEAIPAATALARAVHLWARKHPRAKVFTRPETTTS